MRTASLTRGVQRAASAASRRPKTTVALWLLLVVALAIGGGEAGTRTATDLDLGVGQSGRADHELAAAGLQDRPVEDVLVTAPGAQPAAGTAAELRAHLARLPQVAAVAAPQTAAGGRRVLVRSSLRGDADDAADGAKAIAAAVTAVARAHPAATLQQAGDGTLDRAVDQVVSDDLAKAEVLSLPVTLLILLVAFGALLAASLPLLLGLTAVAAAIGGLGLWSHVQPVDESAFSVVVLIGLAVGVDYSLFAVRRLREEHAAGRAVPDALAVTTATVGRAVVVSGATVVIALAGLLGTGLPVFTSMAAGTVLVVLLAILGSLTVLPALLTLVGHRVARAPRWRRGRTTGGPWRTVADAVTRRPVAWGLLALVLLGGLGQMTRELRVSSDGAAQLPQDLPAVRAEMAVAQSFPTAPDPATLVVRGRDLGQRGPQLRALAAQAARSALGTDGGSPGRGGQEAAAGRGGQEAAAGRGGQEAAAGRGGQEAAAGRGGQEAAAGRGAPATQDVTLRVAGDGRTAALSVPLGPDAERAVRRVRDDVVPRTGALVPGATAALTGAVAQDLDFDHRLSRTTPLVVGGVLLLAFGLLVLSFGSVWLAAGVIGLNLMSVLAAYGVMVGVFQHTWAEGLLGFTSAGALTAWVPLLAFVLLFGISMDYTVLVLERVREARRAGLPAREAAAEGIARTAGAVTSAAVVMVAVFAILGVQRLAPMKELGLGLAVAVLLDATLVRAIALPALLALLGERRWPVRVWQHRPGGRPAATARPLAVAAGHGR